MFIKMELYNESKAMKDFEQCPLTGHHAIKRNRGRCTMIKDSKEGFVFGEVIPKNERIYSINCLNGERLILFYSNLENIFTNKKRA